jgi:3-hydroxybutyrate dehydrogenase
MSKRIALVTGSAAGLGLAIADYLAGQGHDVMLHGLQSEDSGRPLAHELSQKHRVRAGYISADLTAPGAPTRLLAAAEAQLGPIDILVGNAVTRHFGTIEQMPDEAWQRALAVNLTAPFEMIRAVLPGMRRRDWGRIVNIASIYSIIATPNRVDYVTTKTALLGLTRAVAIEIAGTGISCNAICPGTLQTAEIEARIARIADERDITIADATKDYLSSRQPSGRYIETAAVTRLLGTLCADDGVDINGAAIPIDAGWSIS